ncbi:MAG: hypothetical protein L6R37_005171 [Teloschistes peruensis]|nr:MAG: hypothetical protein L6R37_005171 [Teloschistes peruensis]
MYKPQVVVTPADWQRPSHWSYDNNSDAMPFSETAEYTVESPSEYPRGTVHPTELHWPEMDDAPLSSSSLTAFAGSQFLSPGLHSAWQLPRLDVWDATPSSAAATVSPTSTFEDHFDLDLTSPPWEPRPLEEQDDHPRYIHTTNLSSHLHGNIHSPRPLSSHLSLNDFFRSMAATPTAEPTDQNPSEPTWPHKLKYDEPLHSPASPAPLFTCRKTSWLVPPYLNLWTTP